MKIFSIMAILFLGFVLNIHAETFTVTRTDDRNVTCVSGVDCSLREAIKAANVSNDADTINFALNIPAIIDLTVGGLVINTNVTVNGLGARNLIIRRGGSSGFCVITTPKDAAVTVNINNLSIVNGSSEYGGGVNNGASNTLNLSDVILRNNSASVGGAILNFGALSIERSTIDSNYCGQGCGLNNNGSTATATISNSTITNNISRTSFLGTYMLSGIGGGIVNAGLDVSLINVTVSHNSASESNGGLFTGDISGGSLFIRNCIVAKNTSRNYPDLRSVYSYGNNLVGIDTGGFIRSDPMNGDQVGTTANPIDPKLGELQNNGGQTDTRALLTGSPAIDAGNNSFVASLTDQRGFARISGGTVDIGAFEVQTADPPPPPTFCGYSIAISSQEFPASGDTRVIEISTQQGCPISASTDAGFITLQPIQGGLSLTVAANTGAARTATITIANQTFTINQAGGKSRKRVRFF